MTIILVYTSLGANLPLYLLVLRKGFKFFPVSSNNHLYLVFGESRDSLLLLVSTERNLGSIWLAVAEALLGLYLCFFALDETETEMLDRPCSIWHGNWQNKNKWVILTSMMALFIFVNEFRFFVLMLYLKDIEEEKRKIILNSIFTFYPFPPCSVAAPPLSTAGDHT